MPEDEQVESVPVATGPGGAEEVVQQENVGRENMAGQGEWPDPDTPPSPGASGESSRTGAAPPQAESYKDLLDADPVAGGSKTTADEGSSEGDD